MPDQPGCPDGTGETRSSRSHVYGGRHGDRNTRDRILTRTLHAFAVQRERLADLKEWPDANRPGVYFLFGETAEEKRKAYIGEAQR